MVTVRVCDDAAVASPPDGSHSGGCLSEQSDYKISISETQGVTSDLQIFNKKSSSVVRIRNLCSRFSISVEVCVEDAVTGDRCGSPPIQNGPQEGDRRVD